MIAVLTFSIILLCSSSATEILRLRDDKIVQTVKDIVTSVDDFIDDYQLIELTLPNIGILPFDPLKLREGKIGQLNTIQLQEKPVITRQQNKDGSSTYKFEVLLGLNLLLVEYQFHITMFPWWLAENGQVILTPQKNNAELKGIVVVGNDTSCDARLDSIDVRQFESFQVNVEPSDIPFVSLVSEYMLNFISPKLLPVTNIALKATTLVPGFQDKFSELVCKNINQK